MKSFNTNRTDNGEGKPLCTKYLVENFLFVRIEVSGENFISEKICQKI